MSRNRGGGGGLVTSRCRASGGGVGAEGAHRRQGLNARRSVVLLLPALQCPLLKTMTISRAGPTSPKFQSAIGCNRWQSVQCPIGLHPD